MCVYVCVCAMEYACVRESKRSRFVYLRTNTRADRHTYIQTDEQADRYTDKQANFAIPTNMEMSEYITMSFTLSVRKYHSVFYFICQKISQCLLHYLQENITMSVTLSARNFVEALMYVVPYIYIYTDIL